MPELTPTSQFEEEVRAAVATPQASEEFVRRLHARIIQQAATRPVRTPPVYFRPAWVIAFVILVLLAGVLAIGPQRVFAAMRSLFGYIPGVGIIDQSAPIRVLAEPVSLTRDGISVTVTSAILTGDKTHVEYRIFGVPGSAYPEGEDIVGCIQQPYLRLPNGTHLALEKDFPPIPENVNQADLVLPCISNTLPGKAPEDWELPLRFISAPPDLTIIPVIESMPSITPSGLTRILPSTVEPSTSAASTPTPENQALRITKVLDIGDKYVLMGEFNYRAGQEASLPGGSWWVYHQIFITGADGGEVPQFYSNDFEPPTPTLPNIEAWLYLLGKNFIPPVTIIYTGEIVSPEGPKEQAEFEFDAGVNPQDGRVWSVNKDFRLGGYNIRLVSIESSSRGYSFLFKADPGASAHAISVEIVGYSPNCGGGGSEGNFSEEFDREVCYASFDGSNEFPYGKLKMVINFQTLARQTKTFQLQWSPDLAASGSFFTPTARSGVCLRAESLEQLNPAPAFLSNGKALMYEQVDHSGIWGLVLYNLDGSGKQVVVSGGNWGSLSPDGSRVAYSAQDSRIHVVDLTSGVETILEGTRGFNLHWSPDGKQIAYIGIGNGAINSAYVVKVDGAQVRQISEWSYETMVGWSPDGVQLYFAAPFTGGVAWKVYAYDIGSGLVQERFTIENGSPKFLNPKLSPDGNWIAYRGLDNSSLYLVRPDGSDMHLVLDHVSVVGIEWSRSGWLGVSLRKANSDASRVVLIKPDRCEAYLLPNNLQGDLEGLFIP